MDCAPADALAPRAFPLRLPPSRLFSPQNLLVKRSLHVHRAGREQHRQVSGGPRSLSSAESRRGPTSRPRVLLCVRPAPPLPLAPAPAEGSLLPAHHCCLSVPTLGFGSPGSRPGCTHTTIRAHTTIHTADMSTHLHTSTHTSRRGRALLTGDGLEGATTAPRPEGSQPATSTLGGDEILSRHPTPTRRAGATADP